MSNFSRLPRRQFLRNASAVAAGVGLAPRLLLSQQPGTASGSAASLRVESGQGPLVPSAFMGLSYENMQLEDPGFFSPANTGLVEQFRAIAPHGVLRLGGNTSEFGWWKAKPTDAAPRRVDSPWKAAGEPTMATVFAITPEAIDNLQGFLQATGWSCIYGLNLGYGTVATDLPEAEYVFGKLGARLEYFQVGNEVDLFKGHLRDPQTWGVERYLQEWLTIARAVQEALPGARFGMPDVAANVQWLAEIADQWAAVQDKPNVVTLSHHYYWGGPPDNPKVNVENLLKPDPKVTRDGATARAAAEKMGPAVRWRMTEGNTVYRGGKNGVSDVFAAALWGAEYLLELMSLGYSGVNLHGGSGHAQAVSVGGVFHGEALMKDPTVPHPKPFYTPIANEGTLAGAGVDGKLNGKYVLEPVGYGMKFVAPFVGATMMPVTLQTDGRNAVAYGARRPDGKVMVAILNKEAALPLNLSLPRCRVLQQMTAPSLDSTEAHIAPGTGTPVTSLGVAPHSAVLVELI